MRISSILFIIFFFSINGLFAQTDSNWSSLISKIETNNSVKIYYDSEILDNISFDNTLDATSDISTLDSYLLTQGYTLLQYTDTQWVILKFTDSKTSQAEWESRNALADLAQKAEEQNLKVIGQINPALSQDDRVRIVGRIIEENSGAPVIGAAISSNNIGSVTDVNGQFELLLPMGEHFISVSSMGFDDNIEKVLVQGDGAYDISLFSSSVELDEIVVTGKADDHNISSVEMGVEELTIKEIQKLPSFMGEIDVIKSLLTLPGVSTAGEGVGGINVRGGNVDQNLVIQDGIVFFNPSHALGFFNLFHPDLVDEVKLFKGNIPPEYGGRISSVLYTTSKDGDKKKWTGKAGLGLTSSRVSVNGPIINDKLSFTLGGRLSTVNWLLNLINVPDVQNSNVNFYDLQTKLNYYINDKSNMGIQYYTSDDDFRLANELQFDYQTNALSVFYNRIIGENKSLNARIVSSKYNSNLNDLLATNSTRFNTGVDYVSAKVNLTIENEKSFLNFGIEGTKFDVNPGGVFPGDAQSDVVTDLSVTEIGTEVGAYVNAELQITDNLKLLSGVRFSGFALSGTKENRNYSTDGYFDPNSLTSTEIKDGGFIDPAFGWEPRVALNLNLSESSSVKLGYNRTYQYLSQVSNSVAATPIDFWKLTDNNIKPQSAHAVSLGLYKNFKDNLWQTSAEVYVRQVENSLAYIDFADLVVNDQIETQLLLGRGRHYGAEVSLEKTLGKVTSKFGYSYSRSLLQMSFDNPNYTINEGEWYPSSFDKPHNMNLLVNINASQRISFNINFSYSTGRPISAPIGKFDDRNVLGVTIFDEVNNFRVPDYHRLDLSINVFPGYNKDRKFKGSWNFSLFNVYGRRNAYSAFFRQQSVNSLKANRLAVLGTVFPSISYNLTIE